MEMSIDEIIQSIQIIKAQAEWDYPLDWQIVLDGAIDTMRKYQQIKADYEARLKADMVAMLTEIQLEIEELDSRAGYDGGGMPTFSTDYIRKKKVNELIQQKINSLKEDEENE